MHEKPSESGTDFYVGVVDGHGLQVPAMCSSMVDAMGCGAGQPHSPTHLIPLSTPSVLAYIA